MKKIIKIRYILILLGAVFTAGQGFAQDNRPGEQLVQMHRCYACHHMTEALIGPPYQAIAARHGLQKELMDEVLARKIILGGGGSWDVIPMVPNEHVSMEDALVISRWILGLAEP